MHPTDDADSTRSAETATRGDADPAGLDETAAVDTANATGRAETDESLTIDYVRHRRIREMIDVVRYCLESISLRFDRWDEPHVKGPGFYLAIVSGASLAEYADPMGTNRWPIEICRTVSDDIESFYEAAAHVASEADGAVLASIDGVVLPQMVRLKDLSHAEIEARIGSPPPYENWMGSRHMSALDTSLREDVVATITLSEETGRVTVFSDGKFDAAERAEIGGRWRVGE